MKRLFWFLVLPILIFATISNAVIFDPLSIESTVVEINIEPPLAESVMVEFNNTLAAVYELRQSFRILKLNEDSQDQDSFHLVGLEIYPPLAPPA